MGRPTSHDRDVRGPGNSVFRREVAGTGSVGESGRFSGPRRSGGGGGRIRYWERLQEVHIHQEAEIHHKSIYRQSVQHLVIRQHQV